MPLDRAERLALAVEMALLGGQCQAAVIALTDEAAYISYGPMYVRAVSTKAKAILDKLAVEQGD